MATRIGLFGGTFDPVHKGHQSIAQAFIDSGFIDELWILLTPNPPHKQKRKTATYQQRLEMLKEAFSTSKNILISTVENSLPKPSYSVFTIRFLKKQYPDKDFYFCMGEDSLVQFNKWKFYNEILDECELLVAQRPGIKHQNVEQNILDRVRFVKHEPLALSSSQIREKLAKGESARQLLPKNVLKVIEKEQLYK